MSTGISTKEIGPRTLGGVDIGQIFSVSVIFHTNRPCQTMAHKPEVLLTILIISTTRNFCVSHTAKTPRFWHGVLALFDAWQCP
ncbi:hypothetical protein, partial [Yersinia wautersii]|uniref:hypothetical protein n=1 Tax=Yersinia wautersii TaxID=1341643 RepID=UPI001EE27D89